MSALSLPHPESREAALPALVLGEREISFGELARRASALAPSLSQGGKVAFVAAPREAPLTLALSAIALGVPLVPLHPRSTESERARLLARIPDARLVDEPAVLDALERPARRGGIDVADDERPLAVLTSSGTSGEPKCVVLSRRAFAASARASASNLGWTGDDRWLATMPFAHAGGLSILTRCLAARRPVVVEPGFDPDRVLELAARRRVSLLSVVPTMLADLLAHPRAESLAMLRAILVGGAACRPDLLRAARARGAAVLTTYGLTETCSQVTTQPLGDPAMRGETDSGVALPGVDVSVVDPDGRSIVGEEGRIVVRGPTLMSGYLGAAPLRRDQALDTGDRGVLDERGRLHVKGRADELVVTGGENVSPLAVETALLGLPGVRECLVTGVPDERWGEIVGALLVLDGGTSVEQVLEAARGVLSSHARPRVGRRVEALPRGATGKPDRRAARALLERR